MIKLLYILQLDLTPGPLSKGEGCRDSNFGTSLSSPLERGWG